MKSIRLALILFLVFAVAGCVKAGMHSLSLRYQPTKEFSSLQQKVGRTLGMAPFKDERSETLYIGVHTNLQGDSSYFKTQKLPLEEAIQGSLSEALSRNGVKNIPISNWDGKPASLKNMETDSVMMIEIKKFWTEGKASLFRTKMKTAIQFVIHLGIKKEGTVFTRNVEVEKEDTVNRSTPERIEKMINQILTEVFDNYFSNPY
jgi:hypothetical protein